MVTSTPLLLLLLRAAASMRVPSSVPGIPGYFAHTHTIGPESQQYGGDRKFKCKSAATCPSEAAAACNATRTAAWGRASDAPFRCAGV